MFHLYPIHFFVFAIFLISQNTQAQNIKILKVKGNKAIIESSTLLTEGDEYTLEPKRFSEDVSYSSQGLRSRKNSISLGASLETIQSSSNSGEIISLNVRYGWNFSTIEIGPYAKYESNNIYGVQSSAYAIGGFFDYNMKPNKDGQQVIWGGAATLGFGNLNAGTGTGTNILGAFLGGFNKWFIFGPQGALRTEVGYKFEQRSRASSSTSSNGFVANLLISFYY